MNKDRPRVGVILKADNDTVEFLGYGVYEGDSVPVDAVGDLAKLLIESSIPNPKIVLDSGKVVYGCECWWGPEEQVKLELKKYTNIKEIDIDDVRKKYQKQKNEMPHK